MLTVSNIHITPENAPKERPTSQSFRRNSSQDEIPIRQKGNKVLRDAGGNLVRLIEKIDDERFLALIRKMLRAGYMEDWKYNKTYKR